MDFMPPGRKNEPEQVVLTLCGDARPRALPATGASKVIVIIPAKEPKGIRNGVIVIENGVGLAAGDDPTEIP